MDKPSKFVLPSPNFQKSSTKVKSHIHFLTPSGMTLLPRERQPPPMYGPRGATIPAKFLKQTEAEIVKQVEHQFCEACEIELQSDDMARHTAQHQRCEINNCSYVGHPSVMDKHVALLHSSGIFDKCKKLSTPEEIAAWREERRKRFPTLANVEMKKRAQEQRIKRGERLEANKNRFGKRDDRLKMRKGERAEIRQACSKEVSEKGEKSQKNFRNKKRRKNAFQNEDKAKPQEFVKIKKDPEIEEILNCEVNKFKGTKYIENYKHLKVKTIATEQNILTSLLGMYGSDEEETDEEETEEVDTEITTIYQTDHYKGDIERENKLNVFAVTTLENNVQNDLQNPANITDMPVCSTSVEIEKKLYHVINDDVTSDEPPEELPIAKSPSISEIVHTKPTRQAPNPPNGLNKKFHSIKKSGLDYRKARLRNQNTMLEKLLEPDIRHERNVLLQCVRFVCESNYFKQ